MKPPSTLILSQKEVKKLITMPLAILAVEDAFRQYCLGKAHMPPKIYLDLPRYKGDFRAMPSYIDKINVCGLKWVNSHPLNNRLGLPSVMAVMILNDPRTGLPLAVMDATYLTSLRTGASGAVAVKYLARKNAKVVAFVGCGAQARTQLAALCCVRKVERVHVWGHQKDLAQAFVRDVRKNKGIFSDFMKNSGRETAWNRFDLVICSTVKECVRGADIIITSTPSRKPIVRYNWIAKGAHINAIGADAQGKQELDPALLKKAKVVVDDWAQASHSGEINNPVSRNQISRKDVYAELGQIVAGRKQGRVNHDKITVFDSTGLAIQDTAVAYVVFKNAIKRGIGRWIGLV